MKITGTDIQTVKGKNKDRQELVETQKSAQTVEVLCQKMGDRWFAFSLIDDEVFVGSIQEKDLERPNPRPKKGNT